MKALLLERPGRLEVADVPEPECGDHDVLIQVGAVGVCGTDFHIFQGEANYNSDSDGRTIPLSVQPQILGHEFCGTVLEAGARVRDLAPGDRVAVDQGLNCYSQRITPVCEYCTGGDSHQCLHYQELGITGIPGGMRERVAIPAVNAVRLEGAMGFPETALSEPLGCILHALDRVVRTPARYMFHPGSHGSRPVENVLILGAGPAGLLFLQNLRREVGFEGVILVADRVPEKLSLVKRFGGTPLDVGQSDLVEMVSHRTRGRKIDLLIEATGSGAAFRTISSLIRKQATVLLYGHGHQGTDLSVINLLLFLEPTLVVSVGASGALNPATRRSETTTRAVELIQTGQVDVRSLITHRYPSLETVRGAFGGDSRNAAYIKGVLQVS